MVSKNSKFMLSFAFFVLFSIILVFKCVKNDKIARSEFGILLENNNFKTMIEIGVKRAIFTDAILSKWPSFQMYYGVDPWKHQASYIDSSNVNDNEHENYLQQTKTRLKKYGNKIKLIRNYSTNAVNNFKNESIDFIYLDGRHDYCGVLEDLKNYYPILKCNGIMSGDDYITARESLNINNGDDWSICENGEKILINGGSVKGI